MTYGQDIVVTTVQWKQLDLNSYLQINFYLFCDNIVWINMAIKYVTTSYLLAHTPRQMTNMAWNVIIL